MVVLLSLLLWGSPLVAVDYVTTQKDGNQVFTCNRPGFVGRAKVKQRAPGLFQVWGPYLSRVVPAPNHAKAAALACGELRQTEPPQTSSRTE